MAIRAVVVLLQLYIKNRIAIPISKGVQDKRTPR